MHGDGGALRRNWSMCAAMRSVVCMVRATLGDVNATQGCPGSCAGQRLRVGELAAAPGETVVIPRVLPGCARTQVRALWRTARALTAGHAACRGLVWPVIRGG
jgi:hypothetical protein